MQAIFISAYTPSGKTHKGTAAFVIFLPFTTLEETDSSLGNAVSTTPVHDSKVTSLRFVKDLDMVRPFYERTVWFTRRD